MEVRALLRRDPDAKAAFGIAVGPVGPGAAAIPEGLLVVILPGLEEIQGLARGGDGENAIRADGKEIALPAFNCLT